jgi:hypothetical protein
MSILFVFVDGIGLGNPGKHNLLSTSVFSGFEKLAGGQKWTNAISEISTDNHVFRGIDACLGIEGLPQSGTGQVSLFAGVNAAAIAGRHWGPYPHSATKELLSQKSFFRKLLTNGKKPFFINAYPQRFFDFSEKSGRWSTASLMVRQCGLKLNTLEDVIAGRALTAEVLQDFWRSKLNLPVPDITPEIAASRLNTALERNDLVFLEYYLTDKAGHEQEETFAMESLLRIDAVLEAWLRSKRSDDTLVLTSDHGNVEDLSVKTHTMNPVPFVAFGPKATFFKNVRSLPDVCEPLVAASV